MGRPYYILLALALVGIIAYNANINYNKMARKLHSHVAFRMRRATTNKVQNVRGSCVGSYYGRAGHIGSPNYPSDKYPALSSCNYTITASKQYVIKFEFLYVDMEDAPVQKLGDCGQDYIEIRDGPHPDSPLVGGQRFCGYDTPFNPVYSTTSKVYIYFRSDESIEGQGFAIRWTATEPPKDEFDCTFESVNGLCFGWTQSKEDDFDWLLNHGQTQSGKSSPTGPLNDHTTNNRGGTYFYLEATGQKTGEKTILMTPLKRLISNNGYCFQLWYHMRGEYTGTLNIYKELVGDPNSEPTLLFTKTGEQGEEWLKAEMNVSRADYPVRFLIEGIRGDGFTSDIAIDDISIEEGLCDYVVVRTTTTTAKSTTTTIKYSNTQPSTTKSSISATTTTAFSASTLPITTRSTTRYVPQTTTLLTNQLGQACEGKYVCDVVGNCIDADWKCDGVNDCQYGDDEKECGNREGEGNTAQATSNPVWGAWTDWSTCSKTCAGGSQSRTRSCNGGEFGQGNCLGFSFEAQECNSDVCREWTDWGNWTICSASCGGGYQSRTRTCVGGKIGDVGCTGSYVQVNNCNEHNCPKCMEWGDWSPCVGDCEKGKMTRTRVCVGGSNDESCCEGGFKEEKECMIPNMKSCTEFTEWGEWSECSVSCLEGIKKRTRKCLVGGFESTECEGLEVTMMCDAGPCPTTTLPTQKPTTAAPERRWGDWGAYGKCTKSCGSGFQTSTRDCINGNVGQLGCRGLKSRKKKCNMGPCISVAVTTAETNAACQKRNLLLAKTQGRKCLPACRNKCKSKLKKCVCDGSCGKTCQPISKDSTSKPAPTKSTLPCKKRKPFHNACCAKLSFSLKTGVCCDGVIRSKLKGLTKCCGKENYSPKFKGCCNDVVFKKALSQCVADTIVPK